MTVVNLKARPKALPDRINQDISNSFVLRDGAVHPNRLTHLAQPENASDVPESTSVPLSFWLNNRDALKAKGDTAVQIAADESPDNLVEYLHEIDVIVLPFVSNTDGRSYSHAYRLRTEFNFAGQIRAIGDVKYDQLGFLSRVGVDAFELSDGEDYENATSALKEFSEMYQPSADEGQLVFARRRLKH